MTKKYTKNKQLGNKGAAYLEALLSDYAIVHRIDEAKDIGCDLICEWVNEENPSRLLFFIQIKTSRIKPKIETITKRSRLNLLEEVKIKNRSYLDANTLDYWRGFEIPVYLFVLFEVKDGFDIYYKRFTPALTTGKNGRGENFYKVSRGGEFLAFAEKIAGMTQGGFVRDLFIDYMRCHYKNGSLAYKNPRDLGLDQFPEKDAVFSDLAKNYDDEIKKTADNLRKLGIIT